MANTFVFDDDEPQPDMSAPNPESSEPEQPEGGEGNNRTFLIAAVILGGVVLLSLICMAVYALLILPGQKATVQATSDANLAAIAQATNVSMETQVAALFTATLPPSETPVPQPTETQVVVFALPTDIIAPTTEPATATFEAMQTQVAVNLLTAAVTSTSSASSAKSTPAPAAVGGVDAVTETPDPGAATGTAAAVGTYVALGTPASAFSSQQLAKTGFADEVGLPALLVLSIVLVAVILVARKLRQAPSAR